MKERNITITIDKAREWYNSENDTLKKIALQAFSKNELKFNFRNKSGGIYPSHLLADYSFI